MSINCGLHVLVGTADGLHELGANRRSHLAGHEITALAREGSRWWTIVDGRTIWYSLSDGLWEEVATAKGLRATCLGSSAAGLLVGTSGAHLLHLDGRTLVRVDPFEEIEGRKEWYTPWGGPPDTRSISEDACGVIYVNVHVGGVVCSTDGSRSWRSTLDIHTDVHQVLAHPARSGLVLAASAVGLAISADGGDSWSFETEGLHATYLRAVAVAEDVILVTASTGPGGKRAAIYRKPLGWTGPFERCRRGLPEWFTGNIDTACLAASGTTVVFGTADGSVFLSTDQGRSWEVITTQLPPVHCVALG